MALRPVMNDNVKENLKDNSSWMRILYTLLFVIIFNLVEILIAAVVIFQLIVLLVTGNKNERLVGFGATLAQYAYRIIQYLTFNTDDRPFPFADWESEVHLVESDS
jgi:hypothetical protein